MNTEDDFQRHLDAHPDDATARMVFADWLQERDDPRAEGYRALGALRKRPCESDVSKNWCWFRGYADHPMRLHEDWFDVMKVRGKAGEFAPAWTARPGGKDPASRRELEDAAALAFARLPESRRDELLGRVAA